MKWVMGLLGGYLKVPPADKGGVLPLYVVTESIKRTTKRIGGMFKLSNGDKIRWKITKGGVIQCYGGDPRTYVIVQKRIDAIVGHWSDEE